MREIKYRYVWESGKPVLITTEIFSIEQIEDGEMEDFIYAEQSELGESLKLIERNLYTGLKDVGLYLEGKFDSFGYTLNRKEIYSHDILEVVTENVYAEGLESLGGGKRPIGQKFVVEKLLSGFTLIPAERYSKIDLDCPNQHGFVTNYNFWKASMGLKLIGNIHENLELLEGK